jgi:thioredoxin 1
MAIEINDVNFDELVSKSTMPVLLDFWAEWCGPCKRMIPLVEELTKDYEGKAVIGKVDVESAPGITAKYGVMNIPTILFFKNGEVADKQVGVVPKTVLAAKLDALM